MKWNYRVEGKGRGDAPWAVTGSMEALPGHFPLAVQDALKQTFFSLTEGTAEYGDLGTCQGPYRIEKLIIELTDATNSENL